MKVRRHLTVRRRLLAGAVAAGTTVTVAGLATPRWAQADTRVLRIGYQKSSTLIAVLKANGGLEQRLAPAGWTVSWHEFTSGLPLLESLNVGNIDFSADVAETVPIFAQAAGAQLSYVAREAPSPSAQAILVPAGSTTASVADLKGRRVGFAKAAGVHYLLIAALDEAGLRFSDIEPAYLSPADGRAAFERGAIDAWVVWDPFLAAARIQSNARILRNGEGLASYQRFYLAGSSFARQQPEVLRTVRQALVETGHWVKAEPAAAAALLAPIWGLSPAIIEQANGRRSYAVSPVTRDSLSEQQTIADAFLAEKLLPRRVDAMAVDLFDTGANA